MLIESLVFGTGRLAPGPYARPSRELLEICMSNGIRQFDTGPSYGMGQAERMLGEVSQGLAEIRIATKLGAPVKRHGTLLGWAKLGYNLYPRRRVTPMVPYAQYPRYREPPAAFEYAPQALEHSLARSLQRLKRSSVDGLLLHEADPKDLSAAGWEVLDKARAAGTCKWLGYAHGGPENPSFPALVPQTAPEISDFIATGDARVRRFFAIRTIMLTAQQADPAFARHLADFARGLGLEMANPTQALLAALALLKKNWAGASLIVFTTDRSRLRELIAGAKSL